MSRYLRLPLFVVALLACAIQPRAQVINLTPHCDDVGIFAWGQFSDGESPAALKSNCDGTVPVPGVSNASSGGAANQVAAFSAGRGVAFNGSVDWSAANQPAITFPPVTPVEIQVWVLHTDPSCDILCVRLNMANFLVWANDRLSAERTGIQLIPAGGGAADWVSDQTSLAGTSPVKDLLDFEEDGSDCARVSAASFPLTLKKDKIVNVYIIRTERGLTHRGFYCEDARDAEFANAFVASKATDSTFLHEVSHNLGLGHFPGKLNVMNMNIQDGAFFTEGQTFRMNFASNSALTLFGVHQSDIRDCTMRPPAGCPAEESGIWPDP